MSAAALRIEELTRDLIVDEGFSPLEKVMPLAGSAGGLFNACMARLDSDRLELHAFLAWHGQDSAELKDRADSLRQALAEGGRGISQRITATLFLVAESDSALPELDQALSGVEEGHFLEKILIATAGVGLNSGRLRFKGRIQPRPGLGWFEGRFSSGSAHSALEAESSMRGLDSDDANARRLLSRGRTWASWTLIVLCVTAFITQCYRAWSLQHMGSGLDFEQSFDLALRELGANQNALVFGKGQWWRMASSLFLHGGELHLLINMISLFSLGTVVERVGGPWKFLLIYLGSGLAGSFLSAANGEGVFSVGASGAILGLAGALLALRFRRPPGFPDRLAQRIAAALFLPVAFTLGVGILFAFSGGPVRFDNWAHFGGLFTGFALVLLWPSLLQKSLRKSA